MTSLAGTLQDLRVGVAFPWPGIVEREHGSAQRIGLLLDFLRESVGHVAVLSPGFGPDETHANVAYVYHQPTAAELAWEERARGRFRTMLGAVVRTPLATDEDLWLWRHLEFRFRPSLARSLLGLVRSSDVVLVSFSFWTGALARLGRRHGVAIVATAHDQLSGQVRSSRLLRWLTRRAEVRALRRADHCFVSSTEDLTTFARDGVRAEVLLPGVDLRRGARPIDVATRARLRERLALGDGERVCLFIGAVHGPNYEAAAAVRTMAQAVAARGHRDVRFVIAGDVMAPQHEGNLTALGRLDQPVLDELHRMADLVLVPLSAGTGVSRKTLEAMAFGKAILATTVGFRGIPVATGTHGIVCDDLAVYPDRIIEILADADVRRRLGAAARAAVAAYDYRTVYRRYLDVIAARRSPS